MPTPVVAITYTNGCFFGRYVVASTEARASVEADLRAAERAEREMAELLDVAPAGAYRLLDERAATDDEIAALARAQSEWALVSSGSNG